MWCKSMRYQFSLPGAGYQYRERESFVACHQRSILTTTPLTLCDRLCLKHHLFYSFIHDTHAIILRCTEHGLCLTYNHSHIYMNRRGTQLKWSPHTNHRRWRQWGWQEETKETSRQQQRPRPWENTTWVSLLTDSSSSSSSYLPARNTQFKQHCSSSQASSPSHTSDGTFIVSTFLAGTLILQQCRNILPLFLYTM